MACSSLLTIPLASGEGDLDTNSVVRDRNVKVGLSFVDAVIVPCAGRKSAHPSDRSRALSLPVSTQADLETAWLERLSTLRTIKPAASLYGGRGFRLALKSAEILQAPLFVLSAGLGLVAGRTEVPSYGMTVAGRGNDTVGSRVRGRFDSVAWWKAVSRGPFSFPLTTLVQGRGSILAALSQPYARMIARELEGLSDADLGRVRICGLNLAASLPGRVQSSILPYDERLHGILAGTRADFAQRALFHFASTVLAAHPHATLAEHSRLVAESLSGKDPIRTVERTRVSDDEIIRAISLRLASGMGGIQRTLHAIRHENGIGCEQARFSRLYKHAESRRLSP